MRGRHFPLLLVLVLAAGCAGPTQYVHPNADLAGIQRVAVLPFGGTVKDPAAVDKVESLFLIELLSLNIFEVAEPGHVRRVLREQKVQSLEGLAPEDLKKIGEALGAHALFMGSLLDYRVDRGRGGDGPEVTLQVNLVETQSGVTVWASSASRSGTGLFTKLFGVGRKTATRATQELIHEQLAPWK